MAIWYLVAVKTDLRTLAVGIALFFLCHLSITMGPHRLYAHASYKARRALECVLLSLFSAVFQNSALWWSTQHVLHHAHVDTERDPYSVRHGFWWAHCGWALHSVDMVPPAGRRLLKKYPLLDWQQRNHVKLGFLVGFVLPTVLGALWSDLTGGLLVGGFLRLVVQYHLTWSINSVAHYFGKNRYGGTARSNVWLGIPTVGEGSAHDRHHRAEEDYRIDPRWWAPDPGKWVIWLCSKVGLAYDLKRVPEELVLQRTQLAMS